MNSINESETCSIAKLLLVAAAVCYFISFGLPFVEGVYGVQIFLIGMLAVWYPPSWVLTIGWLANPIGGYMAFRAYRCHSMLTISLICCLLWTLIIFCFISLHNETVPTPGPAFWFWELSLWLIVIRQRFLRQVELKEEPDFTFEKYRVTEASP